MSNSPRMPTKGLIYSNNQSDRCSWKYTDGYYIYMSVDGIGYNWDFHIEFNDKTVVRGCTRKTQGSKGRIIARIIEALAILRDRARWDEAWGDQRSTKNEF
jgi:hypothetical protein